MNATETHELMNVHSDVCACCGHAMFRVAECSCGWRSLPMLEGGITSAFETHRRDA